VPDDDASLSVEPLLEPEPELELPLLLLDPSLPPELAGTPPASPVVAGDPGHGPSTDVAHATPYTPSAQASTTIDRMRNARNAAVVPKGRSAENQCHAGQRPEPAVDHAQGTTFMGRRRPR
jgi:hypothetical protein